MKLSNLLLIITLLLPLQAFSGSDAKKQWAKEFDKLVKEKDEQINPLRIEMRTLRPYSCVPFSESDIPTIKKLIVLISECLRVRRHFVFEAIQIGDNSFQGKIVPKVYAERNLIDSEMKTLKAYKEALINFELPIAQRLITASVNKVEHANKLYTGITGENDYNREEVIAILEEVIKLYQEAIYGYQDAIDMAESYISGGNKQELNNQLNNLKDAVEDLNQKLLVLVS